MPQTSYVFADPRAQTIWGSHSFSFRGASRPQTRLEAKQERKWELESAVRTIRKFLSLAADEKLFAEAKEHIAKQDKMAKKLGIGKPS